MNTIHIIAVSDIHMADIETPAGDILLFAGDATFRGTVKEITWFGQWLDRQPQTYKIVIAGNHDWLFETDKELATSLLPKGVIYLENEVTEVMGLKIAGFPIQPEFCSWAFNVNRGADIRKYWDMIPESLDILITHGPPYGIADQVGGKGEHLGCWDLNDVLTKKLKNPPKIVTFGHIHSGFTNGKPIVIDKTSYYNVAIMDETYTPTNFPTEIEL